MKVTKDLAELCALLIDEVYGELPSRIFSVLLSRGRSSVGQLGQYTSMTQKQLRHGLAVLIQQNLLYYYVDHDTKTATYEANPDPAYNLIRIGKILEMVESAYGPAVKDVMQSLLLLGQTRVSDLKAAYEGKIRRSTEAAQHASLDADMVDGEAPPVAKKPTLPVKSVAQLNSIICRLAEAELVDVVHGLTLVSPEDVYKDVEERVTRVKFPGGVKGGKGKAEFEEAVAMELCKVRRESKSLKRKLEDSGPAAKRRKLLNGAGANGVNGVNGDHEPEGDPVLDPRLVIRVNYEKCIVELRNRRLQQFASEMIGDTTSYVYAVMLKQITKRISRCHTDPRMDIGDMGDEDGTGQRVVTTTEILDNLPTTVDPWNGLAKVSLNRINKLSAEAIQPHPPDPNKTPFFDGGDDDDDDEDEDSDVEMNGKQDSEHESEKDAKPAVNGSGPGKVRFAEPVRKESRLDMVKQHLYLLAENRLQFIRQCGKGQWTVDFKLLIQHLREAELDTVIERTVGRQGLRLVRILRKKGKLDEKALPNISLMKKSDVQNKMLEMEIAGFVDIQEVPRDNSRTANRTIFLWYTDTDRCIHTLLNKTYKTATRCLQRLSVHRRREKDVLLLTRRTDVKGREKDVMQKEYYDRFAKLLEIERKLLGHMMRMDDLVAVLRDY